MSKTKKQKGFVFGKQIPGLEFANVKKTKKLLDKLLIKDDLTVKINLFIKSINEQFIRKGRITKVQFNALLKVENYNKQGSSRLDLFYDSLVYDDGNGMSSWYDQNDFY